MLRLSIFASLFILFLAAQPDAAFAKKKKDADPADPDRVALDAENSTGRFKAVELLFKESDEKKFQVVSTQVIPNESAANVLAAAVDVLSRIKDDGVRKKVMAAAAKGKAGRRVLYLEAVATYRDFAPGHELLLKSVKDKEPYIRGMAAWGLGEHGAMDALEPLLRLLKDAHWQVQAAALEAIPLLKDKAAVRETVPTLVDYLDDSAGRMKADAAYALERITGKKHGRDVEKWRKHVAGEVTEEPETKKPSGPYAENAKSHYYATEVKSDNIVIIFDRSLSMYGAYILDKSRLRRESRSRVLTGGDGTDQSSSSSKDEGYRFDWWRIKTRLDMAREQAKFLISQLRSHQKFELIFFSTDVEPWMGRMVKASTANKSKAMLALDETMPDDKTNTWGALAAAFDLMDNEKKSYKAGPDELYLITDGMPSVGDIVDRGEITDAVLTLHKVNRIRINCIGIGVRLPFMKKICSKTGGRAVFY